MTTTRRIDTLPDYLRDELDIVFVGLNPGRYSAEVGHYFAHTSNRIWPALSASGLVPRPVGPEDDERLLGWGFGLTDVVKRPTRGVHELKASEFRRGTKLLRNKIARYGPRIVCFVGLMGYRACCRDVDRLDLRNHRFGGSHIFVLPSTSPRNARYSLADLVAAFRDLKDLRDTLSEEILHTGALRSV